MNRTINFYKKNLKEVLRDPVIYIFCLGFPVVMFVLFQIINKYTNGNTPMFEIRSLLPSIIMFSYSFIMLLMALLVSKDRQTFFLKRLYSSPMKSHQFIIGYSIVGLIVGVLQTLVCIICGLIICLISKYGFISVAQILLLFLSQLPILFINIFLGILFGTLFNDKTAPGICSVFISLSGILGGCWMPLENMGAFETFCRFLPFYPSVSLGRAITNATTTSQTGGVTFLSVVPIFVFLTLGVILALVAFKKDMISDK